MCIRSSDTNAHNDCTHDTKILIAEYLAFENQATKSHSGEISHTSKFKCHIFNICDFRGNDYRLRGRDVRNCPLIVPTNMYVLRYVSTVHINIYI